MAMLMSYTNKALGIWLEFGHSSVLQHESRECAERRSSFACGETAKAQEVAARNAVAQFSTTEPKPRFASAASCALCIYAARAPTRLVRRLTGEAGQGNREE